MTAVLKQSEEGLYLEGCHRRDEKSLAPKVESEGLVIGFSRHGKSCGLNAASGGFSLQTQSNSRVQGGVLGIAQMN